VYIYCNYKKQAEQKVQEHFAAHDKIKSLYKDKRTRPTLDELRETFRSEIERFSKVFIIVDAPVSYPATVPRFSEIR